MTKNRFWDFVTCMNITKYSDLVDNPNIDWKMICANSCLYMNKQYIRKNTSITVEEINLNKAKLNKYLIVSNENYLINENDCDYIFSTINDGYFSNPNIIPHLIKLYDTNPTKVINLFSSSIFASISISSNTGLTWEIITHLKINWNYTILSLNHAITWEIVQANKHLHWNYNALSSNINITFEIVKANPQIDWLFENLTSNPNITWDIIQTNPDYPWVMCEFLKNPNITYKLITENRNLFKDQDLNLFAQNHLNKHIYFTLPYYRKKMTKKLHDQIYQELIMRACHPKRTFQWNEHACDLFPDKYMLECKRFKFL